MLRDNNQNELFFADKVVVCEGCDEYAIKAAAHELFRRRLDAENVSVIAVNGKDNIAPLVKLVLKLGLECYVVSDFDFLLRDRSEDCKAYDAKAHDSIVSLPPDFFRQARVFGPKGDDVVAELHKLREKIKSQSAEAFFEAKRSSEVPISELAKILPILRRSGIGLLDGEVEDLSIEPEFLSATNKLALDKVYQIRARLNSGQKFSSFMKLDQLKEILGAVFDRPDPDCLRRFEELQRACKAIK